MNRGSQRETDADPRRIARPPFLSFPHKGAQGGKGRKSTPLGVGVPQRRRERLVLESAHKNHRASGRGGHHDRQSRR